MRLCSGLETCWASPDWIVNLVCLGPTRNVNDGEWIILLVARGLIGSAGSRDLGIEYGGAWDMWVCWAGLVVLAKLCGTHLLKSRDSMDAGVLLLCSSAMGHDLPDEGGYS